MKKKKRIDQKNKKKVKRSCYVHSWAQIQGTGDWRRILI